MIVPIFTFTTQKPKTVPLSCYGTQFAIVAIQHGQQIDYTAPLKIKRTSKTF